ncbi:MAG: hypothetical protein C5B49_03045 [Bdellovibrio sp.]|nr:MAG: hypothetical protein C5B49_03045 [Bdellovibrio sp.]
MSAEFGGHGWRTVTGQEESFVGSALRKSLLRSALLTFFLVGLVAASAKNPRQDRQDRQDHGEGLAKTPAKADPAYDRDLINDMYTNNFPVNRLVPDLIDHEGLSDLEGRMILKFDAQMTDFDVEMNLKRFHHLVEAVQKLSRLKEKDVYLGFNEHKNQLETFYKEGQVWRERGFLTASTSPDRALVKSLGERIPVKIIIHQISARDVTPVLRGSERKVSVKDVVFNSGTLFKIQKVNIQKANQADETWEVDIAELNPKVLRAEDAAQLKKWEFDRLNEVLSRHHLPTIAEGAAMPPELQKMVTLWNAQLRTWSEGSFRKKDLQFSKEKEEEREEGGGQGD